MSKPAARSVNMFAQKVPDITSKTKLTVKPVEESSPIKDERFGLPDSPKWSGKPTRDSEKDVSESPFDRVRIRRARNMLTHEQ